MLGRVNWWWLTEIWCDRHGYSTSIMTPKYVECNLVINDAMCFQGAPLQGSVRIWIAFRSLYPNIIFLVSLLPSSVFCLLFPSYTIPPFLSIMCGLPEPGTPVAFDILSLPCFPQPFSYVHATSVYTVYHPLHHYSLFPHPSQWLQKWFTCHRFLLHPYLFFQVWLSNNQLPLTKFFNSLPHSTLRLPAIHLC